MEQKIEIRRNVNRADELIFCRGANPRYEPGQGEIFAVWDPGHGMRQLHGNYIMHTEAATESDVMSMIRYAKAQRIELARRQNEIDMLRDDLGFEKITHEEKVKALQNANDVIDRAYRNLLAKLKFSDAQVEEQARTISHYFQENTRLNTEAKEFESTLKLAKHVYEEKTSELREKHADMARGYEAKIKELRQEKNSLTEKLDKATGLNNFRAECIASAHHIIYGLREENGMLKKSLGDCREICTTLREKIKELETNRNNIPTLAEVNRELACRLLDFQRSNKDLQEKISRLESDKNILSTRLENTIKNAILWRERYFKIASQIEAFHYIPFNPDNLLTGDVIIAYENDTLEKVTIRLRADDMINISYVNMACKDRLIHCYLRGNLVKEFCVRIKK